MLCEIFPPLLLLSHNQGTRKKQLKDVGSPDDGSSELKMVLFGIATKCSGHNH